jgi:ubiquinol-cytochrome c reductase cytochrome c1 subunit
MTTTSFRLALAGLAAGLSLSLTAPSALAAEGRVEPPAQRWSFSGPFGKFDRAQLQRGYKVYKEVCSNCHSATLVRFRNLAQPGGPEFSRGQVTALAATFQVKDGPNEQAARAANGGAYPLDFSVLAKARTYERGFPRFIFDIFSQYQEQGPDYIHALLVGYKDAPQGFPPLLPGQNYNEYMPGHLIAMPKPISDGQVEYPKGVDGKSPVPETVDQYAKDVSAFMVWMAEPHLEERKRIGMFWISLMVILAGLLYYTKKKVWARMPDGSPLH